MRSPRVVVAAMAVVLVVMVCGVQLVAASSSGALSFCDLQNVKYGRGTIYMPWVNPVTNATFYTVRSADGSSSADPTYYYPGALTPIHIRVTDLTRIFIGMQIYATNAAGSKVGTWTITTGLPFWNPPACGAAVVTHSDADLKPIHVVLFYTAPAGTGPVTFQIMIKQGEQNKGSFFYPAQKLTLTERAVQQTQYVQAAAGQSCNAACLAQTSYPYCDPVKTAAIASSSQFTTSATIASMACTLPILSGCSTMAPFRESATDYCYYHSTNCTARIGSQYVPGYAPAVCYGTDGTNERLCGCSATAFPSSTGSIEPQPTASPSTQSTGGQSRGSTAGHISGAPATTQATAAVAAVAVVAAVWTLL